MKKIKKIISTFMLLSVIGCLSLSNSLVNAYADEVDGINYSINSNGETVMEDGEYTTIIGEPTTEVKGLTGEEAVKMLQAQTVNPRLNFGVSNAVTFNVRYEYPVTKTYPISVYKGTSKVFSGDIKITLTVSATSDTNKSIKSNISVSNFATGVGYSVSKSTSSGSYVSSVGSNTKSLLTCTVVPVGGTTEVFKYYCNNKILSGLSSNTQVGPGFNMQQYWTMG